MGLSKNGQDILRALSIDNGLESYCNQVNMANLSTWCATFSHLSGGVLGDLMQNHHERSHLWLCSQKHV